MVTKITNILKGIFGESAVVTCISEESYKEYKTHYKFTVDDKEVHMDINNKLITGGRALIRLRIISHGVEYLLINLYYQHIPISLRHIRRVITPILPHI